MAASLYIVVEGEDPGFDIFVNGRALARNEEALHRLAARLHVNPLLNFFSADENSMALLLEQGAGDPGLVQAVSPGGETADIDIGLSENRARSCRVAGVAIRLAGGQEVTRIAEADFALRRVAGMERADREVE